MGSVSWQLGPALARQLRNDPARGSLTDDAPSVLFVDDDPTAAVMMRARYAAAIAERRIDLHFARDAREALALLRARPELEVVVTDLEMPGTSGLELLAAIRREFPLVRAVVVSGHDDLSHVRAAMNQGALDFLTKPIDFYDFEVTLAKTVAYVRERARAEHARREKLGALGRLVTSVAHELSTPLGVAVTATSLARGRARDLAKRFADGSLRRSELERYIRDAREITKVADDSLRRVSGLLDGFKRVAVDHHPDARQEVLLDKLLERVSQRAGPLLRGTDHCVVISCPRGLTIETFPEALTRALTNLIANAIEHAYGPSDFGTIELQATRERDDAVTLRVIDDGRGMSETTRAHAFEPFYTTRRADGSSGLGLFVVHNIVTDLLQGTIRVESSPGAGTRVALELPRALG